MKQVLAVGFIRVLSGATTRWLAPPTPTRQCIYFANHTSHLDAVVLWASLPQTLRTHTRPVAAKDYWSKSALRLYLAEKVFHAVLIDRTKIRAQNNPIRIMTEAMGENCSLIIFPEGTRGTGEGVESFKSGLFHLAQQKPEAVFVPVYIENLNRILPKGEFLPIPLLSSVTFGSALSLVAGETKQAFLDRARQALCDLKANT